MRNECASSIYASAELAHRDLLQLICGLSEDRADLVAPAFTVFETHLLSLRERIRVERTS